MFVKICGIQTKKDAIYAVKNGADAIGFVFAKSKRRISPEKAKTIAEELPANILRVGVFVNPKKAEVAALLAKQIINTVQLHGDESNDFISSLTAPAIKAFKVGTALDYKQLRLCTADYILLDAPAGQYQGGNGTQFNWQSIQPTLLPQKRVFIAGGLTADNVQKAIAFFQPFGVDTSSGVETVGKKDPLKIQNFIKKAKGV